MAWSLTIICAAVVVLIAAVPIAEPAAVRSATPSNAMVDVAVARHGVCVVAVAVGVAAAAPVSRLLRHESCREPGNPASTRTVSTSVLTGIAGSIERNRPSPTPRHSKATAA